MAALVDAVARNAEPFSSIDARRSGPASAAYRRCARRAHRRSDARHLRILPHARGDHARADHAKRASHSWRSRPTGRMPRASITMSAISSFQRPSGLAFARFPTWMWRNKEVREFVDWLRAAQCSRSSRRRRVAFHGLDLYSLHNSIRAVLDYLDRVDPAAAEVARVRYGCLTPWQADPATYGRAALTGQLSHVRERGRRDAGRHSRAAPRVRAPRRRTIPRRGAERAAGRQRRALLSDHVLRLARLVEFARHATCSRR